MLFKYLKYPAYLASFLLLGCVSTNGKAQQPISGTPMDFEIILQDGHSNFEELTSLKIDTQSELERVFAVINSTRKPGYKLPVIDFTRYQLYFYCPGSLSTGGHTLSVEKVTQFNEKINVTLTGTSPGPGEYAITVITSPFVLVKFENIKLPIEATFNASN